jgi:hypothetical protein
MDMMMTKQSEMEQERVRELAVEALEESGATDKKDEEPIESDDDSSDSDSESSDESSDEYDCHHDEECADCEEWHNRWEEILESARYWFEKEGIKVAYDETCCNTCGHAEMEGHKEYVFIHNQQWRALRKGRDRVAFLSHNLTLKRLQDLVIGLQHRNINLHKRFLLVGQCRKEMLRECEEIDAHEERMKEIQKKKAEEATN